MMTQNISLERNNYAGALAPAPDISVYHTKVSIMNNTHPQYYPLEISQRVVIH